MRRNLWEGSLAPEFSLPGYDGKYHSLAEFHGKEIILYFYPKDNTPGCTKEAYDFRDAYAVIKQKTQLSLELVAIVSNPTKTSEININFLLFFYQTRKKMF